MDIDNRHIKRIKAHQRIFLRKAAAIEKGRSLAERCCLAQEAATFAVTHTTDIFCSPEVEEPFLELAQSISIPLATNYRPDTVLHVMTEAYTTGGHTRCVERWISRMTEQEHSCIVLRQRAEFPKRLRELVELSGGKMYTEETEERIVKKAIDLRRLAARFEYVVLHVHMDDPTALIAFGTKEFTRPVVFFNHAYHIFWLGVSIADCVADLNIVASNLTRDRRGAQRSFILGIPLDDSDILSIPQAQAREKLGIPQDRKIIYSGGQKAKYLSVTRPDFRDIITGVLKHEPSVHFYIAGVDSHSGFWSGLMKKHPNHLHLLGKLEYATVYPLYLSAADMVLDSYPVGGGTAAIDAVKAGKPVLTLGGQLQMDYLTQSSGKCASCEELIEKTLRILHEPDYAHLVHSDLNARLLNEVSIEHWKEKCRTLLRQLPAQHSLYPVPPIAPAQDISESSSLTCRWTEPGGSASILRRIRKGIFQHRRHKDTRIVRLLGIYLSSHGISKYETGPENFSL